MTDGVDVVLDVVVIRVTLLVILAMVVVDVEVVPEWEPTKHTKNKFSSTYKRST